MVQPEKPTRSWTGVCRWCGAPRLPTDNTECPPCAALRLYMMDDLDKAIRMIMVLKAEKDEPKG
jgi:hypothetical protein